MTISHDQLYRLYEEFDAGTLRAHQEFVDLFPPIDARMPLSHWRAAREELDRRKRAIRAAFPDVGDAFADLAARATRDQAFTALDLYATHGRGVDALVLDVDETLRSAGRTDNEIPRETLNLLTRFHEAGTPIVICTGQTLENVKGFLTQGLGSALVGSGTVSVVYEAGTGVFTPGHGDDTKRLLYEHLDDDVRATFDRLRSAALADAPADVARRCHLQGNEFNVTLKPNAETGSDRARTDVRRALVHLLDALGASLATVLDATPAGAVRAHHADRDSEIGDALAAAGALPDDPEAATGPVADALDRIDVAYYEADAAEVGSLELDKPTGVAAALDVLGLADPFMLVMGDSKSDLRVMEWAADRDAGIAAAPDHASPAVLDHVRATDGLVFDRGDAAAMLRTVYALDRIADLGGVPAGPSGGVSDPDPDPGPDPDPDPDPGSDPGPDPGPGTDPDHDAS